MNSFADFNLNERLLATLSKLGFEKPSPIQAESIPLLKDFDRDFIGLAPTGTGKTAAFSLPLLNNLDPKMKALQALILCPTRELALQVATQINKLGEDMGLRAAAVYGGSGYSDQLRALRSGVPIIVGTPGRLLDHLRSGNLRLDSLKALVLDEADEMISMGFQEDIETILEAIPEGQSRLWLFSATMSPEIRRIADNYLTTPARVELTQKNKVPDALQQIYYVTRESNKPDVLGKLIEDAGDFYGLIFCQTKVQVSDLTQRLVDSGYKVDCLHGDKTQEARERTLRSFRERKLQILVCTDVAARGIDVQDITHVVNYSIPRETENYVHRIGRTARNGKPGIAMSLVSPAQRQLISRCEKRTGVKMKEGVIPSNRILKEKKLAQLFLKFQTAETHPEGLERVSSVWGEAIKEMTREEIAARLLALISPDLMQATPVATPEAASDRPFGKRKFSRDDSSDRDERRPSAGRYSRGSGGSGGGYARRDRGDNAPAERTSPWRRREGAAGERSERPASKPYFRRDEGESRPPRRFDDDGDSRPRKPGAWNANAPKPAGPRKAFRKNDGARTEGDGPVKRGGAGPSLREESQQRRKFPRRSAE
ncbi:MAG: DEAD/DEAH box helicase [Bdellovibrionaceae bacterium]|nr:DEAD/DEAH box helicase [Pseudobdellovibrionaceae bacterium]